MCIRGLPGDEASEHARPPGREELPANVPAAAARTARTQRWSRFFTCSLLYSLQRNLAALFSQPLNLGWPRERLQPRQPITRLPWGLSGGESACQCRSHGFDL